MARILLFALLVVCVSACTSVQNTCLGTDALLQGSSSPLVTAAGNGDLEKAQALRNAGGRSGNASSDSSLHPTPYLDGLEPEVFAPQDWSCCTLDGLVQGRVVLPLNRSTEDLWVSVEDDHGRYSVPLDAEGRFAMTRLPARKVYRICVRHPLAAPQCLDASGPRIEDLVIVLPGT
jgi:hypothetical protein